MGGYNQEMNNGQYDYGGSSSLNPFGDDSWGDKAIAPIVPGGPVSILPGTKYLPGMSKMDGWVGEKVFGKGGDKRELLTGDALQARYDQLNQERLARADEFNKAIMAGTGPSLFGNYQSPGTDSSPDPNLAKGGDSSVVGPPMTTDPSNIMTGGMSSQSPALNLPTSGL